MPISAAVGGLGVSRSAWAAVNSEAGDAFLPSGLAPSGPWIGLGDRLGEPVRHRAGVR